MNPHGIREKLFEMSMGTRTSRMTLQASTRPWPKGTSVARRGS